MLPFLRGSFFAVRRATHDSPQTEWFGKASRLKRFLNAGSLPFVLIGRKQIEPHPLPEPDFWCDAGPPSTPRPNGVGPAPKRLRPSDHGRKLPAIPDRP